MIVYVIKLLEQYIFIYKVYHWNLPILYYLGFVNCPGDGEKE